MLALIYKGGVKSSCESHSLVSIAARMLVDIVRRLCGNGKICMLKSQTGFRQGFVDRIFTLPPSLEHRHIVDPRILSPLI